MKVTFQGKPVSFGNNGFVNYYIDLVFYIKDLSVIVDGKFIDSSGNLKVLTAATTTLPNDSIIMPANDVDIIEALTNVGLYSTFYTNDSTPKTVLLSDIPSSSQHNRHFYDSFNNKNWMLYKKEQTESKINDIYSIVFGDPATTGYVPIWGISNAVNLTLKGSGSITINWNDGNTNTYTLTTGGTAITKTYSTKLGKQKNIIMTGNLTGITSINATTAGQAFGFRITNMSNLNELILANITSICGSVTNLPLTYLYSNSNSTSTMTGDLTNKHFTYIYLNFNSMYNDNIRFTGTLSSSALTYMYLNASSATPHNGSKLCVDITNSPLTYLNFASYDSSYIIGSVTGKALSTRFLVRSTNPLTNVTGSITGMPLTYLYLWGPYVNITGDLTNLPLTYITLYINNSVITGNITGKAITYLYTTLCPNVSYYTTSIPTTTSAGFQITVSPNVGVSGDISYINASTPTIIIGSGLTSKHFYYSGGTIPAWAATTITIQNMLTTNEVDNFLINWATTAGVGTKTINLAGDNQPRSNSTAVNNAITTLTGKGKTIITNV